MKSVIALSAVFAAGLVGVIAFMVTPIGILMLGIGVNPDRGPGPLGWWSFALIPVWIVASAAALKLMFATLDWHRYEGRFW